jgi:conjugal transfer pilus assembly protein TraF
MKRENNIRSWLIVFVALQMVTLVINSNISFGSDRIKPLQGFNWYNEKLEPKKEKVENTQKQDTAQTAPAEDLPVYEKNIRSLQERHKKAHRQALDNPTPENILTELYLEKEMMRKAQLYGERRVALAMMSSQFTDMKAHSNVLHKRVQEEIEDKEMHQKLSRLSQEWGLILQVSEDCPHCHAFAPIVLEFARKYGFQLLAANKKGEDFKGIKGITDNGEMLIFNPTRETPLLYLIKSNGREVFPIARGINSANQILTNIKNIDKHIKRLF